MSKDKIIQNWLRNRNTIESSIRGKRRPNG